MLRHSQTGATHSTKLAFNNGMIEGNRKDIFKSSHMSQRLKS
jgi:hypothetical protein